jgi:hypothetical protein
MGVNMTSKIINEPSIQDIATDVLRSAIEHRATWLYLLLDEAKKNGTDPEKIGRAAIFRCGMETAKKKIKPIVSSDKLSDFFEPFISEPTRKALEVDIIEKDDDKLILEFHYCPLISGWRKSGATDEEIALLCDIAMDGDRGIAKSCGYDFEIKSKLAEGDPVCHIAFSKKAK